MNAQNVYEISEAHFYGLCNRSTIRVGGLSATVCTPCKDYKHKLSLTLKTNIDRNNELTEQRYRKSKKQSLRSKDTERERVQREITVCVCVLFSGRLEWKLKSVMGTVCFSPPSSLPQLPIKN